MEHLNKLFSLSNTSLECDTSADNIKTQWLLFLKNLTKTSFSNEIPNYLNNIKTLKDWDEHSSASETKIISGDINNEIIPSKLKTITFEHECKCNKLCDEGYLLDKIKHKIIIKISEFNYDVCDNSLEFEVSLYKKIINYLLYENITPHLIGYINDITVFIKSRKYNYLFLEMSIGTILKDYIDNNLFNLQDMISITFQLLYTLSVFNNILLSHNDLHSGNILIEKKTFVNSYKIDDKIYKLKGDYFVKIFDFDNGSIYNKNVCRNIKLDYQNFCGKHNMCNSYQNNDLYLVLFLLFVLVEESNQNDVVAFYDILKKFINTTEDLNNFFDSFRLNYITSDKLKYLKTPLECLHILVNDDNVKDIISIHELNTIKYDYVLPDIKSFDSYKPKLCKVDYEHKKSVANDCNWRLIYSDKFFDILNLDKKLLFNNYKYNTFDKAKELIEYCKTNNIEMSPVLATKLVTPFIYGIPNYPSYVFKDEEYELYKDFSKTVNYVLPVEIINVYGNTGIDYFQ